MVFRAVGDFGSTTRHLGVKINTVHLTIVMHTGAIRFVAILYMSQLMLVQLSTMLSDVRGAHTPTQIKQINQAINL